MQSIHITEPEQAIYKVNVWGEMEMGGECLIGIN